MTSWCTVLDFLRSRRGLPDDCLRHVGISSEDAAVLEVLLVSARPKTVLEIGTFVGLSAGVIAAAIPPESTFVCVDPNLSVRHQQLVGNGSFGLTNDESCFEHLEAVLEHVGRMQNTVLLRGFFSRRPEEPVAGRLLAAGVDVGSIPVVGEDCVAFGPFDFVFVDGDHSERGVSADLELIARILAPTAVVAVHDLEGDWREGPRAAISQFISRHPMFRLECRGNIGVLFRRVIGGRAP